MRRLARWLFRHTAEHGMRSRIKYRGLETLRVFRVTGFAGMLILYRPPRQERGYLAGDSRIEES